MTDETVPEHYFVYTPEGGEPKKWLHDPTKLLSPEAEEIERLTGLTFGMFMAQMPMGSMLCIRAYLYVLLKRETPDLKFENIQITFNEVDFEEAPAAEPDPKVTPSDETGTGPSS